MVYVIVGTAVFLMGQKNVFARRIAEKAIM